MNLSVIDAYNELLAEADEHRLDWEHMTVDEIVRTLSELSGDRDRPDLDELRDIIAKAP